MLGLIGQNDRMLQCRYHWGCLLPVPTRYLTLPTLVSTFSVLFVWYPFEFSGSMHWLLRVLPKCKFHSSIRAMSGFLSTSARARNEQRRKKQNASILPRQSSATKTITACTRGIRSHGGALSFIAELIGNSHGRQQWIYRKKSFIAELIGNSHGRQQWICVLFG